MCSGACTKTIKAPPHQSSARTESSSPHFNMDRNAAFTIVWQVLAIHTGMMRLRSRETWRLKGNLQRFWPLVALWSHFLWVGPCLVCSARTCRSHDINTYLPDFALFHWSTGGANAPRTTARICVGEHLTTLLWELFLRRAMMRDVTEMAKVQVWWCTHDVLYQHVRHIFYLSQQALWPC